MISSLTYLPRGTAVCRAGAGAASLYLFALAAIAFIVSNPILLAGLGVAVAVAGVRAGAGRALLLSLRWGATLAVLVIAVNAVAAQRGDTILLRGPTLPVLGAVDVSLEALIEGCVLAARVALVIAVFCVHSAVVDPDRLLRMLRPVAKRSALTAALITRLVPLAARDHERLAEAAKLRGPAAAGLTRPALVRRLVAGSLDRALDVAATLELRGYSGGVPGRAARPASSPRDALFIAAGVAAIVSVVMARLSGLAGFDAYPTVTMASGPATIALALLLPVLAGAPFSFDRARREQRLRRQRRRPTPGLHGRLGNA